MVVIVAANQVSAAAIRSLHRKRLAVSIENPQSCAIIGPSSNITFVHAALPSEEKGEDEKEKYRKRIMSFCLEIKTYMMTTIKLRALKARGIGLTRCS